MSIPPIPQRPRGPHSPYNSQPTRPNSTGVSHTPPFPSDTHISQPLAISPSHRFDLITPLDMAQNLDEQFNPNPSMGFIDSQPGRGGSPRLPHGSDGSPWIIPNTNKPPPSALPGQRAYPSPLPPPSTMADISLGFNQKLTLQHSQQQQPQQNFHVRHQSLYGPPPQDPPLPPAMPSLIAPLPSLSALQAAMQSIQNVSHDPILRLSWARDVLFLVDKYHIQNSSSPSSTDPPVGPVVVTEPQLAHLVQTAVPTVLQLASSPSTPHQVLAEAVYLRATFAASGAYPEYVTHNPRGAFRDFESAARAGYPQAWFRLGRDYETFNDVSHAKDCFERGVKLGVESCCYRMGMAHLMGQLGLSPNATVALSLLHRAATLATPHLPQPAYIFSLLLLSEFPSLPSPLSTSLFSPFIPQASTRLLEARRHLERAAYLGFAPAQYKLGHAYEFAQPPFPFDPLLSVQYYSLASQQGEVEADMALSKWFLCGSGAGDGNAKVEEGGFEKDEGLAWTFAEKAARKGLPSAEFAMGYYAEVGIGGPKDLQIAIKWYDSARDHGNVDAAERLAALQQPAPAALSRQEHDTITENKLVRKRTQAKQRSEINNYQNLPPQDRQPSHDPPPPSFPPQSSPSFPQQGSYPSQPYHQQRLRQDGRKVVEMIRQNSLRSGSLGPNQQPQLTPAQQYQQQYQSQHQSHQNSAGGGVQQGQGQIKVGTPNFQNQSQQQHQYPNVPRYTLSDSPVLSRNGSPEALHSRPGTGYGGGIVKGGGIGGGRAMSHTSGSTGGASGTLVEEPEHEERLEGPMTTPGLGGGVVYAPKPSKGPTTFAEMGFQGGKVEDKECIIM